jgi:hypothetical protein
MTPSRAAFLGLLALSCRAPTPDAAVQRAALRSLFVEREPNARLVLWVDEAHTGPVFEALGEPAAAPARALVADPSLGIPVDTVRERDLDSLFSANPDGWTAFFRVHPQSFGLIEVATPRYSAGGADAVVLVGRACGEHCRQAWRVRVGRGPNGAWRTRGVTFVRVPNA